MTSGTAPTVEVDRPTRRVLGAVPRARWLRLHAVTLTIAVTTGIALLLRLYLLARPHYLLGITGYDDGVDFGSALRLIGGSLPYRDYVFVQPPGITVLMAPVALLAKVVGTDSGLAVARVLTVLVGAAGVTLVGLVVRHRGALAVALASGMFAVAPDAILSSHSVLLEPWLVLFCFGGVLALFDGDRLTESRRRAVLGGGLLGFACLLKLWAILPAIVIAVQFAAITDRRRIAAYLGGLFAVPAAVLLPFVGAAPGAFVRDVVANELVRGDVSRAPLIARLVSFTEIRDLNPSTAMIVAVTVALVLLIGVCVVAASALTRRFPPPLECFAIASTAIVVAAFLWPVDYYSHYAGFLEPFLACAVALPVARLWRSVAVRTPPGGGALLLDSAARASSWLGDARSRVGPFVASLRWPVGVFLGSRGLLLGMAVVEHFVRHQPFLPQLATWDGKWYGLLALQGYPAHASHLQTTLGFFPLYPIVIRPVAGALAVLGPALPFMHDIYAAGVIVSTVGGAIATVLVQRLASGWWGERTGRRAAVLFCLFPGSVVFSLVYAEGLLIPLAAGCLLALQRRKWILAGCLAGIATATAAQGLVLIPVCAISALCEFGRHRRAASGWPWRSLSAPVLSVFGAGTFGIYLWIHTGTPLATFDAQHYAWHERTNPLALVDLLRTAVAQAITHPLPGKSTYKPVVAVVGAVLLIVLLVYVVRKRRTMSIEALVWTAGVSFMAVTSENVPPNPRMLITAFPAVMVIATWGRRRSFLVLALASAVLLLGASWLTFTVGQRMLPP
jgi:hypothetical protein